MPQQLSTGQATHVTGDRGQEFFLSYVPNLLLSLHLLNPGQDQSLQHHHRCQSLCLHLLHPLAPQSNCSDQFWGVSEKERWKHHVKRGTQTALGTALKAEQSTGSKDLNQCCLQGGTSSLLPLAGILPITHYQNFPPLPRFLKFPDFFHWVFLVIFSSYKNSGAAVSWAFFPLGKVMGGVWSHSHRNSHTEIPTQKQMVTLKEEGKLKLKPKLKPAQNLTSATISIHNKPFPHLFVVLE